MAEVAKQLEKLAVGQAAIATAQAAIATAQAAQAAKIDAGIASLASRKSSRGMSSIARAPR